MEKFEIESKTGFYIGDICYVLDDNIYHGIWGKADYKDGAYETPEGYKFAVVGTEYGDGCYYGLFGDEYGVDAGVIGIVPLELCNDTDRYGNRIENLGRVVREIGKFSITRDERGTITVENMDTNEVVDEIETGDIWCDEPDEDEYDEYADNDNDGFEW